MMTDFKVTNQYDGAMGAIAKSFSDLKASFLLAMYGTVAFQMMPTEKEALELASRCMYLNWPPEKITEGLMLWIVAERNFTE